MHSFFLKTVVKQMLIILLVIFFSSSSSYAAKLQCSFAGGTVIKDDVWIKNWEMMDVLELFGAEGITLELKASVIAKLDSKEIFYVGENKNGKVYAKAGEILGVQGIMIKKKADGEITIFQGMCTPKFGG